MQKLQIVDASREFKFDDAHVSSTTRAFSLDIAIDGDHKAACVADYEGDETTMSEFEFALRTDGEVVARPEAICIIVPKGIGAG